MSKDKLIWNAEAEKRLQINAREMGPG